MGEEELAFAQHLPLIIISMEGEAFLARTWSVKNTGVLFKNASGELVLWPWHFISSIGQQKDEE